MGHSCGNVYYISSGLVKHHSTLNTLRFTKSPYTFEADVVIKVTLPQEIRMYEHQHPRGIGTYYTTKDTREIDTCNPVILTSIYGQLQKVLDWSDIKLITIFDAMLQRGYVFRQGLGFVTQKDIDHYNKAMKMLFG